MVITLLSVMQIQEDSESIYNNCFILLVVRLTCAVGYCVPRESCEREIDRLHQEIKDRDTQLSTERLKFEYEKEELQKALTEQKELVQETKRELGEAQGELDRIMDEQEEEKNALKKEMATLRDDLVRCRVQCGHYSHLHVSCIP